MENLTPVTLVVKAPNQKIADQTVECALNWTVKKLKEHLAAVYPSKPVETQQRIIYSGQLLQDHLTLKDVLRQYEPNQTTHTVHLVCSPTTTVEGPSSSTGQSHTAAGSSSFTSDEGLRQRHPHASEPQTTTNHQSSVQGPRVPPTSLTYPLLAQSYSPAQMMWMQQQAYYAQYMAQYMQYYQNGMYTSPVPQQPYIEPYINPVANVNAVANDININPVMPAAGVVNGGAVPRQPARPEVVRMNAQGGPVVNDDEDDMQNRDWLDWVYTMLRFAILLCILYFYSTFGRVVATLVLIAFIYLYQMGLFQLHRRNAVQHRQPNDQRQQQQQPQQQPQQRQQQQPQQQQQPNAETDNETDADESQDGATSPSFPTAPAQPSGLGVAWTFLVSFFSSLAPQQPPPVNVN